MLGLANGIRFDAAMEPVLVDPLPATKREIKNGGIVVWARQQTEINACAKPI